MAKKSKATVSKIGTAKGGGARACPKPKRVKKTKKKKPTHTKSNWSVDAAFDAPYDNVSQFLRDAEGGLQTKGYIPGYNYEKKKGTPVGQSGVTIGTGVDVGQFGKSEFENIVLGKYYKRDPKTKQIEYDRKTHEPKVDVPARNSPNYADYTRRQGIFDELKDYTNTKKMDAVNKLTKRRPSLSEDDAKLLSSDFTKFKRDQLQKAYDRTIDKNGKGDKFDALDKHLQEGMLSYWYQNGSISPKSTFWKYLTDQDWDKAAEYLRQKSGERRQKEADLFEYYYQSQHPGYKLK